MHRLAREGATCGRRPRDVGRAGRCVRAGSLWPLCASSDYAAPWRRRLQKTLQTYKKRTTRTGKSSSATPRRASSSSTRPSSAASPCTPPRRARPASHRAPRGGPARRLRGGAHAGREEDRVGTRTGDAPHFRLRRGARRGLVTVRRRATTRKTRTTTTTRAARHPQQGPSAPLRASARSACRTSPAAGLLPLTAAGASASAARATAREAPAARGCSPRPGQTTSPPTTETRTSPARRRAGPVAPAPTRTRCTRSLARRRARSTGSRTLTS
ncbi:hypothetical protein DMC30DRAFT_404965 [Rhodotorula diobovata]|uniref:Uncharacterized protein n=1 Tax=Rhodotorula diobovata TaxID=5288 RepID=A0A5C5FLX3_9BASI|nr:hypothetical protein DMC30DRAFT_404965 [Rhodotorula diobovata]